MRRVEGSTWASSALNMSIHLILVPALRAFIHSMSLKGTSLLDIQIEKNDEKAEDKGGDKGKGGGE